MHLLECGIRNGQMFHKSNPTNCMEEWNYACYWTASHEGDLHKVIWGFPSFLIFNKAFSFYLLVKFSFHLPCICLIIGLWVDFKILVVFSCLTREECDRLTNIVKSRVIDLPITADTEDMRPSKLPNCTVSRAMAFHSETVASPRNDKNPYFSNITYVSDVAMSDMTDKAVMEARKWLEEKKLGSNSKSKLEHGICSLSSVSHVSTPSIQCDMRGFALLISITEFVLDIYLCRFRGILVRVPFLIFSLLVF